MSHGHAWSIPLLEHLIHRETSLFKINKGKSFETNKSPDLRSVSGSWKQAKTAKKFKIARITPTSKTGKFETTINGESNAPTLDAATQMA